MRKYIFLLIFLCCTAISAQEVSHDLDNFTEVKIYSGLQAVLIEADETKAVVSGEEAENVQFTVEEGVLSVKVSIENIWNEDDDTRVNIYYKKLNKIDANQNSAVVVKEVIKQKEITLVAREAGRIKTRAEVDNLFSKAVTGGEVEVSGETGFQEIIIRAGGEFYGKNLLSEDANVTISAGGVADITAKREVTTKVRAGGTVNVYGNPDVIHRNITLGGKVRRLH